MALSTQIRKMINELKRNWLIVLIIALIVYLNYIPQGTDGRAAGTSAIISFLMQPKNLAAVAGILVAMGTLFGSGGIVKIFGYLLLFIGFMFVFTAGLFGSSTAKFILIIVVGIFVLKMISGSGYVTKEQLEPVYRVR